MKGFSANNERVCQEFRPGNSLFRYPAIHSAPSTLFRGKTAAHETALIITIVSQRAQSTPLTFSSGRPRIYCAFVPTHCYRYHTLSARTGSSFIHGNARVPILRNNAPPVFKGRGSEFGSHDTLNLDNSVLIHRYKRVYLPLRLADLM